MAGVARLEDAHRDVHTTVGHAILRAAYDALNAQDYEPPSRGLVVVLDVPEDCCDTIVVALRRLTAVLSGGNDPTCGVLRWRCDWTVTVSRSGDATLGSTYDRLPSDQQEQAVNEWLMADLAALSRAFVPIVPQRACGAVSPGLSARNYDYQPGQMVPHRQGGCAGWTFDFRLTVPA